MARCYGSLASNEGRGLRAPAVGQGHPAGLTSDRLADRAALYAALSLSIAPGMNDTLGQRVAISAGKSEGAGQRALDSGASAAWSRRRARK